MLPLAFALGCSSAESEPAPQSHPAPTLDASSCKVPPAPILAGAKSHVVGDGTKASCTVSALRNALESGGNVSFSCGTEALTLSVTEPLLVPDATSLDGGGKVTLDGAGKSRILQTASQSSVLLKGLTFQNGHSKQLAGKPDADGSGGAIHRGWQGKLYISDCHFNKNVADGEAGFGGGAIATSSSGWMTLVNSTFSSNTAPLGGAVYSLLSELTIVNCHFEKNLADGDSGGAVFTDGAYVPPKAEHGSFGGLISLCGSQFVDNQATKSAGAGFLYTYGIDQLSVNRCEFRGNSVTSKDPGLGGAMRIDAEAFVSNSLFADNRTAGQGAAVWMGRGPAVFENVTFYANHATLWGGAVSYGDQSVTLNNCTLASNLADAGSDTLFGNADTLTANNSLFYQNGAKASPNRHCRNALQGSHNLAYPADDKDACGPGVSHANPLLAAALSDGGGSTQTLALDAKSPAIGAGTNCSSTDQRGKPRDPNKCTLGALEP